MRHRGMRVVVLGLILMFPILMLAVAPRPSGGSLRASGSTFWPTEALLVGGIAIAGIQRRRLLAGASDAAPTPSGTPSLPPARPHVALGTAQRRVARWARLGL